MTNKKTVEVKLSDLFRYKPLWIIAIIIEVYALLLIVMITLIGFIEGTKLVIQYYFGG